MSVKFGVFKIDRNALNRGFLTVKYHKNGTSVRGLTSRYAPETCLIINDMIKRRENNDPNWNIIPNEIYSLIKNPKETEDFIYFLTRSKIAPFNFNTRESIKEKNKVLEKRLDLMLSEVEIGNDSPVLIDEIKETLDKLRKANRIKPIEIYHIMDDINKIINYK